MLFADPIADLAVLGTPDDQDLCEYAEAYEKLIGSVTPLKIADVPEKGRAWLLSLDGEWFECTIEVLNEARFGFLTPHNRSAARRIR
jgi:hypothetical protein